MRELAMNEVDMVSGGGLWGTIRDALVGIGVGAAVDAAVSAGKAMAGNTAVGETGNPMGDMS